VVVDKAVDPKKIVKAGAQFAGGGG